MKISKLMTVVLILLIVAAMGSVAFGKSYKWEPETYTEVSGDVLNPERGYYQMYEYFISDEKEYDWDSPQSFETDPEEGYSLAMLEFNIKAYRDCEISQKGLTDIEQVFLALQRTGMKAIVRFMYDSEGNGIEAEPDNLETVLRHMEQTGAILRKYEDSVYVLQGVFVGSWAEMHTSKFLGDEDVRTLLQKLFQESGGNITLSVRTPAFWRIGNERMKPLTEQEAFSSQLCAKIALFNDGLLSSQTDLGTYGAVSRKKADEFSDKWKRNEELNFQKQLCLFVPNGGETSCLSDYNDEEQVLKDLPQMHLSYLHDGYSQEVMDKWKNTTYTGRDVFNGKSLFEYVGAHLGYRYVLRDCSVKTTGGKGAKEELSIGLSIKNTGFANIYKDRSVNLVISGQGQERKVLVDTDLRKWLPSETIKIQANIMRGSMASGDYKLYLEIGEGNETIRLANEELYDAATGYHYLGALKLK